MKRNKSILVGCIIALFAAVFTGCSDRIMGYSVVLWDMPEQGIQSGDVIPVYIKSNISHVYVAANPTGIKVEIPLWQLTDPVSKGKVKKVYAKYKDEAHKYASVKLDGLPCRAEPVNTAKQVYRLRKNEIIKILYKGEGQLPMAGKEPLPGEWYKILTSDGTQGWCFSYNLNLFETDANGQPVGGAVIETEQEDDEQFNTILINTWYPESFGTMIQYNNIDLKSMNASYKFAINSENEKVILNTKEIHESWDYNGYTKVDDYEYTLNDIPIKIIYRRSNYIVVRYTGPSGKPEDLDFILIDADINSIVDAERSRRAEEFNKLFTHGPEFKSSNYGTLSIRGDGTFKWSGFKMLVPEIIPAGGKDVGTVSVNYSVSNSVRNDYDGVVTFKFEGIQKEVNFLYKLEDGGLRFEDTTSAEFAGNQLISRGSSPVIVYFKTN